MDQTSGTNPADAEAEQAPPESLPETPPTDGQPGFRSRGRARRRARFLRRARELAYRDLGGLVYNLHRFGQRNDSLVLAKLGTLGHIDDELRTIEAALAERRPVTVLREAGITACPRCAAIHGSEDRYCPNCGLPMSRHADLPVSGAPAGEAAPPAPQPYSPYAPSQTTGQFQTGSYAASGAAQGTGRFPGSSSAPSPAPQPAPAGSAAHGAVPAHQPPAASPAPGEAPIAAQRGAMPSAGRSPVPPVRAAPPQSAEPDEPTEIVRPQAPGS